MSEQESIGIRLKKLRQQNNLSIEKISEILAVSSSTYWEWENGRSIRGEAVYLKLTSLYKVSLSYLLTGNKGDHHYVVDEIEKLEKRLGEIRHQLIEIFDQKFN